MEKKEKGWIVVVERTSFSLFIASVFSHSAMLSVEKREEELGRKRKRKMDFAGHAYMQQGTTSTEPSRNPETQPQTSFRQRKKLSFKF